MRVLVTAPIVFLLGIPSCCSARAHQEATSIFDGLSPAKRLEISKVDPNIVSIAFGYLLENGTFFSVGCISCKIQSLGDLAVVRRLNNHYVITESEYHALIRCVKNAKVEFRFGKEVFLIWSTNYLEISPNVSTWGSKDNN